MVDLHLHTMASDGTDEDWKLIEKLRKAGITTFSVTDHDTIGAVSGMEFAISWAMASTKMYGLLAGWWKRPTGS